MSKRLGKRERLAKRVAFAVREEIVRLNHEAAPAKVKGVPYRMLGMRGSHEALMQNTRFSDPWNTPRPQRPTALPAHLKLK